MRWAANQTGRKRRSLRGVKRILINLYGGHENAPLPSSPLFQRGAGGILRPQREIPLVVI